MLVRADTSGKEAQGRDWLISMYLSLLLKVLLYVSVTYVKNNLKKSQIVIQEPKRKKRATKAPSFPLKGGPGPGKMA